MTPDGENTIVVIAGANEALAAEHVESAGAALPGGVAVVLAQLETPQETVHAAAALAQRFGARFVLNASPLDADISWVEALMRTTDPLVVNEHEARALLGADAMEAGIVAAAERLVARGAASAVVAGGRTRGKTHPGLEDLAADDAVAEAIIRCPSLDEPVERVDCTHSLDLSALLHEADHAPTCGGTRAN